MESTNERVKVVTGNEDDGTKEVIDVTEKKGFLSKKGLGIMAGAAMIGLGALIWSKIKKGQNDDWDNLLDEDDDEFFGNEVEPNEELTPEKEDEE